MYTQTRTHKHTHIVGLPRSTILTAQISHPQLHSAIVRATGPGKEHLEENSIKEHIRRIRLLVPTTTLVRADAVAAMERSFLNSGDDGEKGALQTRQHQRAVLPLTGNAIEDHQPPAGADDGVVWLDPLLTRLGPQSDGDCTYTRTCASTLTYTLLYYITSEVLLYNGFIWVKPKKHAL